MHVVQDEGKQGVGFLWREVCSRKRGRANSEASTHLRLVREVKPQYNDHFRIGECLKFDIPIFLWATCPIYNGFYKVRYTEMFV